MNRLLVLSPHLDDAVFSCWHVLDSPRDVLVVNVFTGLPPHGTELPRWDRITGARDPRRHVEQRLAEDREALALIGRESASLGFVERQYGVPLPDVGDVAGAIGELEGDVLAPAGIGHSAHALVRDAALSLDRELSFYADIPYATMFGWPAWVTGMRRDPHVDADADWEPAVESFRERRGAGRPALRRAAAQEG